MKFRVIDTSTGKEVSAEKTANIAKENELMEMDIDQFFIGEDGQLVLADDCGNIARCNIETLGLMPVFEGKYPDLEYMEAVLLGNMKKLYPNAFQKSFWAPQAELVAMFPQTWSNTAGGQEFVNSCADWDVVLNEWKIANSIHKLTDTRAKKFLREPLSRS